MAPFNALAVLADLHSPEAAPADGAIIVTGAPDDMVRDLSAVFVFDN